MIWSRNWRGSSGTWWKPGAGVITLGLMLCWSGCVTRQSRLSTSVSGPAGNQVATTLPAGTLIQLPDQGSAATVSRALVNESELVAGTNVLRLRQAVVVCTVEYLVGRDLRELTLIQELQRLKSQ